MSRSAQSMLVFGIYLAGLGAVLILVPNVLLGVFGMPPANEVWIRVVGVLASIIAFYYLLAVRQNVRPIFQWSVYARASVVVFFTAFVVAGFAPPMLILFGVVDLLAAGWTQWALMTER